MRPIRAILSGLTWLRQMLGWQGLMIAFITLASFSFGLALLIREYQRPHQTRREVLQSVLASWLKAPDYLGLNLLDYSVRWRGDPTEEQLLLVQNSLRQLGEELEQRDNQFPLITILELRLSTEEGAVLAAWSPRLRDRLPSTAETASIPIPDRSGKDRLILRVSYRVSKTVSSVFQATEQYDGRLIEALIGFSGFSLLCFGYMVLYVQELRERVARESAQEAMLDLADRTCHELGNVAFVVANEQRNLSNHLDLIEQFLSEAGEARDCAAKRAGLDADQLTRFERALHREYARRGLAPDLELSQSTQIAREVCRQIAICSAYITQTVQELDGYLKHSLASEKTPPELKLVDVTEIFAEALLLLASRIEASQTTVETSPNASGHLWVRGDKRLLVHALVNLVKNSIEAVSETGNFPAIKIHAEPDASNQHVKITVSDNGPGIRSEIRRNLFKDGVTTKGAGRGRGLAIVRDSLRIQGGTIDVEHQTESGSLFRIVLPGSEASKTHHQGDSTDERPTYPFNA